MAPALALPPNPAAGDSRATRSSLTVECEDVHAHPTCQDMSPPHMGAACMYGLATRPLCFSFLHHPWCEDLSHRYDVKESFQDSRYPERSDIIVMSPNRWVRVLLSFLLEEEWVMKPRAVPPQNRRNPKPCSSPMAGDTSVLCSRRRIPAGSQL